MAEDLGQIPGSANFYVWYDPKHDFHHLEFDLDGGHYDVQYYKIFTVSKNGITRFQYTRGFHYYDTDVIDFFRMGKHKTWEVPVSMEEADRLDRIWWEEQKKKMVK